MLKLEFLLNILSLPFQALCLVFEHPSLSCNQQSPWVSLPTIGELGEEKSEILTDNSNMREEATNFVKGMMENFQGAISSVT